MDETRKLNNSEGTLWKDHVCTVCGCTEFLDFLELRQIPAQDGVLWDTYEEAIDAPRGEITLSLCLNCGFVGNRTFNPDLLRFTGYNVSLEHSPLYQRFIKTLASGLIERYSLRNKTILEIGCGNGYFLKTICALGDNKGIGFDPSYMDMGTSPSQDILFIQDYYSEKYAQYHGNLVCCRQVLDHLANPKAFLKMVRAVIGEQADCIVYFEVPNPNRRLQQFVPWNVGYEHGSWFFPESYRLLFESSGFEVKDVSPCHNGDYLGIEAIAASNVLQFETPMPAADVEKQAQSLNNLSLQLKETVSVWEQRLQDMEKKGVRAIPWGAGEHGIGFLNILNIRESMPFIVDINPNRIGKFLPGTGQKVVAPEFLFEYKPDVVIITNPTYKTEIQDHVKSLGINCDFLVP